MALQRCVDTHAAEEGTRAARPQTEVAADLNVCLVQH